MCILSGLVWFGSNGLVVCSLCRGICAGIRTAGTSLSSTCKPCPRAPSRRKGEVLAPNDDLCQSSYRSLHLDHSRGAPCVPPPSPPNHLILSLRLGTACVCRRSSRSSLVFARSGTRSHRWALVPCVQHTKNTNNQSRSVGFFSLTLDSG